MEEVIWFNKLAMEQEKKLEHNRKLIFIFYQYVTDFVKNCQKVKSLLDKL